MRQGFSDRLVESVSESCSIRRTVWCCPAIKETTPSQHDGDEDAAMHGRYHALPHPQEDIRGRFGIAAIAEKLRETRLRWYGHFLRAESHRLQADLDLEIPGKQAKLRPKQRRLDMVHADLKLWAFTQTRQTIERDASKD